MVNIKVAVRIRPLSHREAVQGEEIVVRKENKSVVVVNPKIPEKQDGDSRQRSRRFSVDFCYDPHDPQHPHACTQEAVYNDVGPHVLDALLEGYNACVLAYGHSASGKTYTVMGLEEEPGLGPRVCQGLLARVGAMRREGRVRVEVSASFLEIYNERVKDLLAKEEAKFRLRVREHPRLGPYVEGLSEHPVSDERSLLHLLSSGNRKRSTAATENNSQSSRSHAVFTIHLRQSDGDNCSTEKWSKVHLVDLAGSLQEVSLQEAPPDERANSAQSKTRLQEGANINKSLVTLGYVISALAESWGTSARAWHPFVPYRNSVLTWLLKDTLGGNSKTIMIATVSPASGCLSETVNTLRYAKRTKRIVNEAVVNEDPKVRTIRELRKEIERLKALLQSVAEGEGAMKGVSDGKESAVNGSANDTFSHESEIFSDSLESLAWGSGKGEGEAKMHRSRPDLIKGISGHLKERPPSSGSQSTSENSVASSLEGRGGGGEPEESKLCKRARMKLFDLRRKLGMARRPRRTVDSDTQTDSAAGTIRVKEKCVETEQDVPVESATQTPHEEKSDKSANTSPSELSPREEDWFSEDSLEVEKDSDGRWAAGCLSCLGGKQRTRGESEAANSGSSDSSFTSAEGAELVSSSEVSEDFVFYGNPAEEVTRERELYTITENSEQSEAEGMGVDGRGRKWREKGGEKAGKAKKMRWGDRQSNCERQYLNLNVSAGSRSPFSIDSHLFARKQSSEGMFTSADSVTLVLMGPAKPKSSVLMEIIRRSLARKGQFGHRRSKSRGVQCEEGLVRSVSVDMAMIALSRIARNEQQRGNVVRAASLDGMDATPPEEKATGTRYPLQQKKSALKTESLSHRQGGEDARQQKKSVSWSGETTYDGRPESERSDDLAVFLKEAIHLLRKINSASKDGHANAHAEAQRFLASENSFSSTWPRRRGTAAKPPTGIRARLGRSVHCPGLPNCEKGRSWCAEETEGRARSCGEPQTVTDRGAEERRSAARLEKCSRRLELAAQRDELREKLMESRGAPEGGSWEDWGGRGRKGAKGAKGAKRRKGGLCSGGCGCGAAARDPCKQLLRKSCQSSFELDSFGPGSKHCHQMCMFCRKKEVELYSSAISLNSECVSETCRLEYYGYCPCSSVRLSHVAWRPRAYMQHLLSLRREIVGRTKGLDAVEPFPC